MSALRFIIYIDDMMEDPEALIRRTNLSMRTVQDRPRKQKGDYYGAKYRKMAKNSKYKRKHRTHTP